MDLAPLVATRPALLYRDGAADAARKAGAILRKSLPHFELSELAVRTGAWYTFVSLLDSSWLSMPSASARVSARRGTPLPASAAAVTAGGAGGGEEVSARGTGARVVQAPWDE